MAGTWVEQPQLVEGPSPSWGPASGGTQRRRECEAKVTPKALDLDQPMPWREQREAHRWR